MPITTAFPNASKLEALQKLCPAINAYKIALYTSAAILSKASTVYSVTDEVVGAGYTAGGKALTGYAATLDVDTAILDFADVQWAASSITARGAVIYDSTDGNKIRAVLDFGADKTSTGGAFDVIMPAPAAATAIIAIA